MRLLVTLVMLAACQHKPLSTADLGRQPGPDTGTEQVHWPPTGRLRRDGQFPESVALSECMRADGRDCRADAEHSFGIAVRAIRAARIVVAGISVHANTRSSPSDFIRGNPPPRSTRPIGERAPRGASTSIARSKVAPASVENAIRTFGRCSASVYPCAAEGQR